MPVLSVASARLDEVTKPQTYQDDDSTGSGLAS